MNRRFILGIFEHIGINSRPSVKTHRLMNKIVGVLIEKLAIETNMVLTQKGLARRFSAQVKTDRRHGHRTAMVRMAFHNSGKNTLLQQRLHRGAACTTESNNFR